MERVCKDLIEHAIKIIDYGKKIIPLTDEENKFCKERKVCYICKKEFSDDDDDDDDDDDGKQYQRVRYHCHYHLQCL